VSGDFNAAIRRAARGQALSESVALDRQVDGDLGLGRGGSARPTPLRNNPGAQLNAAVRRAVSARRGHFQLSDFM
jgi:hypothetical protein